jgi:hypothetical protein
MRVVDKEFADPLPGITSSDNLGSHVFENLAGKLKHVGIVVDKKNGFSDQDKRREQTQKAFPMKKEKPANKKSTSCPGTEYMTH